jgi:hypothetical protein
LFCRKELSSAEVNALIEEGRFFLACQLMKEDKHEKAIEAFQQLKSPYASFFQVTKCNISGIERVPFQIQVNYTSNAPLKF